ncbi:DUF1801 domain-containing protein [Aurantibacter sp.]|uniref:DUF1801 domain-containing protein n=1 Tax=Aurantibacter sp. TaxID=2807103 RepID=UPI0032677A81
MKLIIDPRVKAVFESYPDYAQPKLNRIRELILATASEMENLQSLEETLKWGEPSYLTKHGSTIRMDWKAKIPDQYAVYFKCTSKLVPTFKTLYNDIFYFEGDRAIVFKMNDEVPEKELKNCITMALTYHKIKQLPLLGA